jgi:hypothetical protein
MNALSGRTVVQKICGQCGKRFARIKLATTSRTIP